MWDLLEEPASLAELVAILADAYEEAPAVIEHDVRALLAELESLGAVTRS